MDEVVLDEYRDTEFAAFIRKGIKYPCVVLEGVTSNEEIEFFRGRKPDAAASVSLYCFVGDEPVHLGMIELTVKDLMMLRSIYDYKAVLYVSEGCANPLNLNDAETLVKFIRL